MKKTAQTPAVPRGCRRLRSPGCPKDKMGDFRHRYRGEYPEEAKCPSHMCVIPPMRLNASIAAICAISIKTAKTGSVP